MASLSSRIVIVIALELLLNITVNGTNVAARDCGGVQVCTSAENVHLTCDQCPANQTCRWVRRVSLSEKQELSNGSTWTWMAGLNAHGVYDCLAFGDDNQVLQVVIIPEISSPDQTNCEGCISANVCNTPENETELVFELIINRSSIPTYCELSRNGIMFERQADPDRPYILQQQQDGGIYVIVCPLCPQPLHSIYFAVPTSATISCSITVTATPSDTTALSTPSATPTVSSSAPNTITTRAVTPTSEATPTGNDVSGNGSDNVHISTAAITGMAAGATIIMMLSTIL